MARILILLLLLTVGCISGDNSDSADNKDTVLESGDFVKAEITGRIKDGGEVFYERRTINFILGQEEIFPALEKAMEGMKVGEERNISVSPEEGYGERALEKVQTIQRIVVLPKFTELSPSDFKTAFGNEPYINETITLNYWSARVASVTNTTVKLLHEPENNTAVNTDYGTAIVTVNETHVTTTLTPELGAFVLSDLGKGVISDINESSITVDFNHPLAGKTLVFEVAVSEIIKPGQDASKKY